ncbi:MAG: hypothetical protein AB8U30_06315 [Rickettsiales endosymbiont of Dermacentor nuttalli]
MTTLFFFIKLGSSSERYRLVSKIRSLMKEYKVSAVSLAIIEENKVQYSNAFSNNPDILLDEDSLLSKQHQLVKP